MFQDLRVRVLGIVENMSHYVCTQCGTVDPLFGKGHTQMIGDQLGMDNAFKVPLVAEMSDSSSAGTPAVLALPEGHELRKIYALICNSVQKEL
jgi:ATP-binding protein involved in chromosome partitioning